MPFSKLHSIGYYAFKLESPDRCEVTYYNPLSPRWEITSHLVGVVCRPSGMASSSIRGRERERCSKWARDPGYRTVRNVRQACRDFHSGRNGHTGQIFYKSWPVTEYSHRLASRNTKLRWKSKFLFCSTVKLPTFKTSSVGTPMRCSAGS